MAQRKNYHTIRYGQRDGEIKFGHIWPDNNESAALIRSGWGDGLHYITMDHTGTKGDRKNSTICKSPGPFKVEAGSDCRSTPFNFANQTGIEFNAESGDILIRAPMGKIKIQAQDIELITRGGTGNTGVIRLDSNDKVVVDSKSITMNATESYKIFSEKTLDLVGNAIMNIYGGLMDFADGATKLKGSKCGPSSTEDNAKKFKAEAASDMRDQFAAEAEQAQYEEAVAGGATPAEAADSL
tara:strand:+ start:246 stop:965 length:720 start_codon:yes stop_codon:yes gene_type:complete